MFGIVLALGILAMSVGLIRSETASDLRTLAATGASSWTRRTITGVTAGALALAGAVLGTVAAYAAIIGYSWDNQLDGLSELANVPVTNLLLILVGMPLLAAVAGWLLAGREPDAMIAPADRIIRGRERGPAPPCRAPPGRAPPPPCRAPPGRAPPHSSWRTRLATGWTVRLALGRTAP